MCLFKKQFKSLNDKLDNLSSERVEKLEKDSDELKRLKELISSVRFSVKKALPMEDGTVKVIYEIPSLVVSKTTRNDMFYAINMLELISYEDMAKIQNALDSVE